MWTDKASISQHKRQDSLYCPEPQTHETLKDCLGSPCVRESTYCPTLPITPVGGDMGREGQGATLKGAFMEGEQS